MIENMPAHDKTLFDLILKPGLKKKIDIAYESS